MLLRAEIGGLVDDTRPTELGGCITGRTNVAVNRISSRCLRFRGGVQRAELPVFFFFFPISKARWTKVKMGFLFVA